MLGSTSRAVSLVATLALVVGLGCGPKGGGAGPRLPPAAAEYAGLRWVSADATYALVTRRTEDAVLVLRDLADSLGLLAGEDAASIGAGLQRELGFDPLTVAALAEQGIDLSRGLALWSRGVGPSIAIPLADPARFAALIDEHRSHGAVVQVATIGGVEVYTWRPERELALHWAIVDDWLLAHVQIADEREIDGAWFDDAKKAQGAFASEVDFGAAHADARRRLGTPSLVAVVRVPALFATFVGPELRGCRATLGQVGRLFVGAATDGKDARGTIVAELPGGVDGVRAVQLQQPSGWVAARGAAPLQAEVGLDLRTIGPLWARCLDLDDLAQVATDNGIFGGRGFAHELDLGDFEGRGAAAVAGERRVFNQLIDEIPAPDFLRKSRTVGGIGVVEVNVPVMPRLAYAFIDTTAIVAIDAAIDPLLGPLEAPGDELARLEVRPQVWSAETWAQIVGLVIDREQRRAGAVRGLRRWSLGSIVARLEGTAVVIDLHGQR